MFGFFRRAAMMSALDSCQQYHKKIGLGQELTSDQLVTMRHTSLFKDTANRYKSKGLSKWGGLAWYSARFTSMILQLIDEKEKVRPTVYAFAEKMIGVSLALAVSVQNLNINKADGNAIRLAAGIAYDWVDKDPMTKDIDLAMKELEDVGLI
jgi:hypothetical protein